jgi:Zn-dependent peptidase ImmA (M78 family)
MTAEELAERFDISISAAKIRLQELERLKRRKDGTKKPLPASVEEYLRGAQKKGLRITSLD